MPLLLWTPFRNKQTHPLLEELLPVTPQFLCPSPPRKHWDCREDPSVWVWRWHLLGKNRSGHSSLVKFSSRSHMCRSRHKNLLCHKLLYAQQHWHFEWLTQPASGLEKAFLGSLMPMPIKLLVELVFLMLCLPWNTLLLHAAVYLWRQQSFWIGTVTVLGEL